MLRRNAIFVIFMEAFPPWNAPEEWSPLKPNLIVLVALLAGICIGLVVALAAIMPLTTTNLVIFAGLFVGGLILAFIAFRGGFRVPVPA